MNARIPPQVPQALDAAQLQSELNHAWDARIVPALADYIAIPAKSPLFDADWAAHGLLDTVVRNTANWIEAQKVPGLRLEVIRLPGQTPVLFFELAATRSGAQQTVLMYGHLDKQPEFTGWRSGLGPWTPKLEDGKIYGRGAADDGYAAYASIAAIQALKSQKAAHPRIVGLIETCEESGSPNLLQYIDPLAPGWAMSGW